MSLIPNKTVERFNVGPKYLWEEYFPQKNATEFSVDDAFNPGNHIKGYINQVANMKYGAILITEVNGHETEQFIWSTPKIHYPHDNSGNFSWARDIEKFECFEKLDGSNIYSYIYKDKEGNEYVTYKTRRNPILNPSGKYGVGLYPCWKEVLDMYPDIPSLVYKNKMNMSYEMYGTKNIILVRYPKLIDTKIIFGRDELGHVYSPTSLKCGSVGHAELITEIDGNSNYREEYDKIRAYLETRIKVTPSQKDGEQDLVEGMEGAILYAITGRGCVQYKAKPDYVMDLHIKQSIGIPLHSIMTTVRNSFEEVDIVTFDLVVDLLREEFTDDMIFRKSGVIHRIIDETNLYMKLKSLIVEDYEKEHTKDNSFDINIDKGKVMRYFANRMKEWSLDRRNSGKVYTIIVDNYGGK